jgi:dTDP-4-dehydrorhamnose reductase
LIKILLLGKNGQLGSELQKLLPDLGTVISIDREDLDLCNILALEKTLNDIRPTLIINASAYTAVDRAEEEVDQAMKVNALAPAVMAETARILNAAFIHFSTDYVFDGKKGEPYVEEDATNPLNMYGKSKLTGEKNILQAGGAFLILRTSWVYSMTNKESFVVKVLEWARKKKTLKIVDDQISNPTWARDLATATFRILSTYRNNLQDVLKEKGGIYHLAGNGYTSRYEWARQILANDLNPTEHVIQALHPVASDDFPTPALRPRFSALDCSKITRTFGVKLPDWRESLKNAMSKSG